MKFFLLWILWTTASVLFFFCASTPFMGGLFRLATVDAAIASNMSTAQVYGAAWVTYPAILVALGLFLFMNVSNLLSNVTEIEMLYRSNINPYDVGRRKNVEQVFGRFDFSCFFPIRPRQPTCDGFTFPVRKPLRESGGTIYEEEEQNLIG
eukprot:CAMPEP_0113847682 /NCGR_PEP_ID=MMETSP0372-20130328/2018_1 /TAXON_ID=340204 /ORGANISM="Lankesteria abbotti" /LENGTH=150 /DNA_ID=CAMNT_0000817003 /DNA_START=391 /DNA_END=840 /DNA_ORIENTATION=+ /assembly_acc=CAM_ASM_000359